MKRPSVQYIGQEDSLLMLHNSRLTNNFKYSKRDRFAQSVNKTLGLVDNSTDSKRDRFAQCVNLMLVSLTILQVLTVTDHLSVSTQRSSL